MPERDLDKAASRFLTALRRNAQGLENQRRRILDRESSAERVLPDDPMPVINYGTDPGLDLDYYIYELARLQDVGKSVIKVFGQPPELVEARDKFEDGIPRLRDIRNPLTHPNDDDRLDDVVMFSSVVRLLDRGFVETLVDARYQHHDYALAYSNALTTYLSGRIQAAIAARDASR